MSNTQTPELSHTPDPCSLEELSLENCQAILVCLNTRRFVVAWHDEPRDLWPINGGWARLRDLQPGDEVIYKGERTTIRALDVYR